jgi:hypothetical protein
MQTDIFEVARSTQGQSNPIVTALLYSFCPAAAHWYVRDVHPDAVFDVVWRALEDYATGKSLAECMQAYGLATLIPDIKNYIEQVKLFRSRNSALGGAPELTPLFKGDRAGQSVFGLQNQLNDLGGSWKSVLSYVRVWAFLMRDWKTQMKIPQGEQATRAFKKFIVSLAVPGDYSSSKVHFPVWGWDVSVGRVRSIYLGLLVSNQRQDALRFALVYNSDLVGDKGWPGQRPYLYSLDREFGSADHINLSIEQKDVLSMVVKMYKAARIDPNFPLAVLRDRNSCFSCGYEKVCYGEKGNVVMSASVAQLVGDNPRERSFLTGYRRDPKSSTEMSSEQ